MPIPQNLSPDTTIALMQGTPRAPLKTTGSEGKIDAAARDFEAVFIAEMMKPMIESVDIDDVFGGGKGEEIFRGLMTQEYGKMMAARGGIGLASHVKQALLNAQNQATMTSEGQK